MILKRKLSFYTLHLPPWLRKKNIESRLITKPYPMLTRKNNKISESIIFVTKFS